MLGIIRNPNGQTSALRIVFVVIFFMVFGTWSYISITKGYMVSLPADIQVILGVVFGGKLFQSSIGR